MQLFDPPNILSETNLEVTIYSKEANNSMNIYNVQLQVVVSQLSKIGNYSLHQTLESNLTKVRALKDLGMHKWCKRIQFPCL